MVNEQLFGLKTGSKHLNDNKTLAFKNHDFRPIVCVVLGGWGISMCGFYSTQNSFSLLISDYNHVKLALIGRLYFICIYIIYETLNIIDFDYCLECMYAYFSVPDTTMT